MSGTGLKLYLLILPGFCCSHVRMHMKTCSFSAGLTISSPPIWLPRLLKQTGPSLWPLPTCRICYQKAPHVAKSKVRTGTGCYTLQSHPHYATKLHKEVNANKWLKSLWQRNERSAWLPPITSWLSAGNCICASDSSVIVCCRQFSSGKVKASHSDSAFKNANVRYTGVCKH